MRFAARPAYRRLAFIDNKIRAGEYPSAVSLARQLEVHPRTIHRDLEFLTDSLKAPLEFSRDHKGYRYKDATFALPASRLSNQELVAFFLSERLLQAYRGTLTVRAVPTILAQRQGRWTLWLQISFFPRATADLSFDLRLQ